MNKREQNIIDFIHLQEIAKRVLVVIKRQRKKKLDSPEMDPLPSALMTAEELMLLDEDSTFYIFRTDTNAILARGITGYESAKAQSNKIRKQLGLKWDQVSFRSEKKPAVGCMESFAYATIIRRNSPPVNPFPGIGQTRCAAMISPGKPRSLKRVPAPKGRNYPRSTQGTK